MGFVANDMCGSVTIFGCLFFRVFPTVNPIKKVCCNVVKMIMANLINNRRGCWSCRCKPNWLQGCSCVKKEGMMSIVS
jgi:hypothetical protein